MTEAVCYCSVAARSKINHPAALSEDTGLLLLANAGNTIMHCLACLEGCIATACPGLWLRSNRGMKAL